MWEICVEPDTKSARQVSGQGIEREQPKTTNGANFSRLARKSLLVAPLAAAAVALGLSTWTSKTGNTAMATVPNTGGAYVPACRTDLTDFLDRMKVPGLAAAIVKNGQIVCTASAGMADMKRDRRVNDDTIFLIASVSKTITATAIMQLAERGALQLDDDINKYLPYDITFPDRRDTEVSFRQLLTHTASIRDNSKFIDSAVTMGADSPMSLASLTRGYLTPDGPFYDPKKNFQRSVPGTKSKYSNMGITLAGYLVEVIAGVPFDAYCREHIFAPLGMHQTSWRLSDIDQSALAVPYEKKSSGFAAYEQYGEPNYPDGMLRTSVTELAKFLIAMMEGGAYNGRRILQAATVDEMLKRQTRLDKSQGLVWFKEDIGGRTVWGHDGSDDGASATMWFERKRNQGVILLANGEWKGEEKLFKRLFKEADAY